MPRPLTVVAVAGSLARTSSSLLAARIALESAAQAGAQVELLDVGTLALRMYDPQNPVPSANARKLVDAIAAADGLILSSPMYHGTISGAFKNALDWLELLSDRQPPYLADKPVGLIATAGGVQALQAINTMEYVVRALRGWTVPLTVPIGQAWRVFDRWGEVTEPAVVRQLQALGREVVRMASRFVEEPAARHRECVARTPGDGSEAAQPLGHASPSPELDSP
jgi:FMN reductase